MAKCRSVSPSRACAVPSSFFGTVQQGNTTIGMTLEVHDPGGSHAGNLRDVRSDSETGLGKHNSRVMRGWGG